MSKLTDSCDQYRVEVLESIKKRMGFSGQPLETGGIDHRDRLAETDASVAVQDQCSSLAVDWIELYLSTSRMYGREGVLEKQPLL